MRRLSGMMAAGMIALTAGCAGLPLRDEALPVVTVMAIAGPAQLRAAGDTAAAVTLTAGDTLASGSVLAGLADSTVIEIEYAPGGRSNLRGDGELTVAFGRDTIRNLPFISLFLKSGVLSTRIDPARDRRFTVTTVAATAGVRGTAFDVIASADGSTELYVDTGLVELTDNQTGEALDVGAGEAAEDMVDQSPARRQFLAWFERHRWTPQFVRERREQLRRQIQQEFAELDGTMALNTASGKALADSVMQVHSARAAAYRDGYDNDTFASFGAWVGYLHGLAAQEIDLYGQLVALNLRMNQYRAHLQGLATVATLTDEQQAALTRMADRVGFEIDNNRRLFFMGDPLRQMFLKIGDFFHPGDESEYYHPAE